MCRLMHLVRLGRGISHFICAFTHLFRMDVLTLNGKISGNGGKEGAEDIDDDVIHCVFERDPPDQICPILQAELLHVQLKKSVNAVLIDFPPHADGR